MRLRFLALGIFWAINLSFVWGAEVPAQDSLVSFQAPKRGLSLPRRLGDISKYNPAILDSLDIPRYKDYYQFISQELMARNSRDRDRYLSLLTPERQINFLRGTLLFGQKEDNPKHIRFMNNFSFFLYKNFSTKHPELFITPLFEMAQSAQKSFLKDTPFGLEHTYRTLIRLTTVIENALEGDITSRDWDLEDCTDITKLTEFFISSSTGPRRFGPIAERDARLVSRLIPRMEESEKSLQVISQFLNAIYSDKFPRGVGIFNLLQNFSEIFDNTGFDFPHRRRWADRLLGERFRLSKAHRIILGYDDPEPEEETEGVEVHSVDYDVQYHVRQLMGEELPSLENPFGLLRTFARGRPTAVEPAELEAFLGKQTRALHTLERILRAAARKPHAYSYHGIAFEDILGRIYVKLSALEGDGPLTMFIDNLCGMLGEDGKIPCLNGIMGAFMQTLKPLYPEYAITHLPARQQISLYWEGLKTGNERINYFLANEANDDEGEELEALRDTLRAEMIDHFSGFENLAELNDVFETYLAQLG
jgi:hypothetical protein